MTDLRSRGCCMCGSKEGLWRCKTCGEWYCETHWHVTEKGKNVECSYCESRRKGLLE